ncbi:MAG: hypothetical protein OER21_14770 [Gemmatimonadota bacterium]|nr:hypothetical protein [Gemmatimonadota bacterium]
MSAFAIRGLGAIDAHPRLFAGVLGSVFAFFAVACIAHEFIPVCHYVFQCDHRMH